MPRRFARRFVMRRCRGSGSGRLRVLPTSIPKDRLDMIMGWSRGGMDALYGSGIVLEDRREIGLGCEIPNG